jgi:invasion protein IalB
MRYVKTVGAGLLLAALAAGPASADWSSACEAGRCRLSNSISQPDGHVIASLTIQPAPVAGWLRLEQEAAAKDKQRTDPVGVVSLPLGIYLPAGVQIVVDDKTSVPAELIDCDKAEGCRAGFIVSSAVLRAFRHGHNLDLTIVDAKARRQLKLRLSLKGFTSAYETFAAKR